MNLLNDIRIGTRLLVKERWATLAAATTLALGIAVNTTVFTMVNGLLFRGLPFEEPDRVVELGNVSYADLLDWRATTRTFEGIAVAATSTVSVSDEFDAAAQHESAVITSNAFALLRQPPLLGRVFGEEDDRPGAAPVVIVGHGVWHMRYQSDPGIIGRTTRVNGVVSTIVGVMPPGFGFPRNASVWQPMSAAPAAVLQTRENTWPEAFARLASQATIEQARVDLAAAAARLDREYPDRFRQLPPRVIPFGRGFGPQFLALLSLMFGAVAFVLFIACANVANLLLARTVTRAREIAVRLAIGASRWRVVRQFLVESLLLATIAGVLALALSIASVRTISALVAQPGGPWPYWLVFPIDWRVFTFLASICLATALLSGIAPAWIASKVRLANVMNDGSNLHAGSRRRRRWTSVSVAGQLALTLVLLSGAGLMVAVSSRFCGSTLASIPRGSFQRGWDGTARSSAGRISSNGDSSPASSKSA